ncbi:MAG: hypothetical protein LBT04_05810, partial [Prevotellaceae bacterium]|nr:hypothetical protein [Prevotellaceae bacterium]
MQKITLSELNKNIRYILLFCLTFCCHLPLQAQNANPFLEMAGKPYSEYGYRLQNMYYDYIIQPMDVADVVRYMQEAASVSGDNTWLLEAELYEIEDYYYRCEANDSLDKEKLIADYRALMAKADKAGAYHISYRALMNIGSSYRYVFKNYELAFECYNQFYKMIESVPVDSFPLQVLFDIYIANLYNEFDDYETALNIYKRVDRLPKIANRFYCLEAAYNGIGLIYRNYYHDFEMS